VRPRRWWILAVGGATLTAVVHALRFFQTRTSDDAFIAFRYARQLAEGSGLVWNVGERPLEGFTSLLHVLLLAGGYLAGVDPVLAGQLLGLAGLLPVCAGTAWLAAELSGGDRRVAAVALPAVALAPPLAAWSRGGLETTLFTGLLALAVACWLGESRRGDRRRLSPLIFLAAILARPEAAAVAGLAIAFDLFERPRNGRGPARAVASWWPLLLSMALYLAWKLSYFGELLPNPYYAKLGGGLPALRAGLRYTFDFFLAFGALNLLLAVVPPLVFRGTRSRTQLFLLALLAGYSAHVIRVGGDYQSFGRYLVPLLPPLVVLAAHGALAAWDRTRALGAPKRIAIASAVALAALAQLAGDSIREVRGRDFMLTRPWSLVEKLPTPGDPLASRFRHDFQAMGQALRRHFPSDRTVAALAVGAIGYYSGMPVLDLLGINDARIARLPIEHERFERWNAGHMKGSAAELLRRRPDYLLLDFAVSDRPRGEPAAVMREHYPFIEDLLDSAEFRSDYLPESCRLEGGRWMNYHRRREAPRPTCVGRSSSG
jgi:arabinofuranosyltransferase